jgi:hypothetical protein
LQPGRQTVLDPVLIHKLMSIGYDGMWARRPG